MEKLMRCFMSVLLLSTVLSSGLTEEKFVRDGGTLELGPDFFGMKIDTVTWKLNSEMVAEWLKSINDVTYYGVFEGRTTLDIVTGTLEITNMSPADSGEYSVEINNKVLPERYNVKLIKEVPQPVVVLKPLTCSAASDNCNLVCDGKTEGAEPVTYSWKMGEGEWMDGKKIRTITNDMETQGDKTFSCRMKNPISEKHSDTIKNIFYNENVELWIKLLRPVMRSLVILSLLGAVLFFMWRKRESVRKLICPCLIRKDDDDDDDYEIVA